MMVCAKFSLVCLVFGLVLVFVYCKPVDDKYTTKYDNVDLDEILTNKRLLKNYVNCMLDKGSCTPDGAELKKNLPDAMQDNCSKCSDSQLRNSHKVLNYLINNEAEIWGQVEKAYDPEGVYRKSFCETYKDKEEYNIPELCDK